MCMTRIDKNMYSHLYKDVHDEKTIRIWIVIRTEMCMTKTYTNMNIQSTKLYMTKHTTKLILTRKMTKVNVTS